MPEHHPSIRQKLAEARSLLLEAAHRVDEETAVASTENPQWRVRDILAHVAGAEAGLLRNIERFLTGGELPPGFSLDLWNQRQVEKRQQASIAALVAELEGSRQATWALLDRLSDADLAVPGVHPAGFHTTVAGMFLTIANHELDHGNEIRAVIGLPITLTADWQVAMVEKGDQR